MFLVRPGKKGRQAMGCEGINGRGGKIASLLMFIKMEGEGYLTVFLCICLCSLC